MGGVDIDIRITTQDILVDPSDHLLTRKELIKVEPTNRWRGFITRTVSPLRTIPKSQRFRP